MRLPAFRTLPSSTFVTPSASAMRRTSSCLPLNANADVRAITFSPGMRVRRVDDFLGQPVAEVLVLLVAAHVLERQHDDRRLFAGRARRHAHRARRAARASSESDRADRLARHRRTMRSTAGGASSARRIVAQHRAHDLRGAVAVERAPARQQLVQHRTEAEDVRARIERLAFRLLGRHVGRRADDGAVNVRVASSPAVRRVHQLGDAEIEQLRVDSAEPPSTHDDVCRLQIAMQDAPLVRGIERAGNLTRHSQGIVGCHRTAQRAPSTYSRTR